MIGLTIDTIDNLDGTISSLTKIPGPKILRLVCDYGISALSYLGAAKALSELALLVVQPVDSSDLEKYTLSSYNKRFSEYLATLGGLTHAFEIGNEVNGSWCGKPEEVASKANNAQNLCSFMKIPTMLTLFAQTSDDGIEPIEWYKSYWHSFSDPTYLALSCYPRQLPIDYDFESTFTTMDEMSLSKTIIGELGSEDNNGNSGLQSDKLSILQNFQKRFPLRELFWWDYVEDQNWIGPYLTV